MKKLLCLLTLTTVIIVAFYFKFFTIGGVTPGEKLDEHLSPNGKYTVTAYLNNGGATTGFAVLCTVKEKDKPKEKNIYWNYRCESAKVKWIDETTVSINGTVLDITRDTYDFRKD